MAPRASAAAVDRPGNAGEDASAPANYDLTIEQLAAAVGMSVRNIRNHQSRGLLPPPDVRARVGYYGAEHVVRLRLIQKKWASEDELKKVDAKVRETVNEAAEFATNDPEPDPSELYTDIYA